MNASARCTVVVQVMMAILVMTASLGHPLAAQEGRPDAGSAAAGSAAAKTEAPEAAGVGSADTAATAPVAATSSAPGSAALRLRPAAPGEGILLVQAQDPPFTLRAGARIQLRFLGTSVEDESATGAFLIRRARMSFAGTAYDDFGYQLQLEMAGGAVSLIDASVRYQLAPIATLWMGRGKAPFGRQQLNSSGELHFVDRNIVSERFAAARHQGVALQGARADEILEYQVGVYNGAASIGSPGTPFTAVGRVVWTPFGAYPPREGALDVPGSPRLALGLSGMSAREAGPGGSDITRMNVEFAYKVRGISVTSELFREWLDPAVPAVPVVTSDGFYVQGGYLFDDRVHELAGRIAVVDTRGAELGRNEFGVAHSYYMREHRLKLQTDVRYLTEEVPALPDRFELRTQLQIAL